MKKGFFAGIIVLIVVAPLALPLLAHAYNTPNIWDPSILKGPLISCTGNPLNFDSNGNSTANSNACLNLCDLIYTIVNVIYFAIGVVLWVLSPILITVGGIMYLVAGANPEMVGRAKKTLTGTVIGIFIVLCSWLIINTFISFLGITGIGGFGGNAVCTVAPSSMIIPTAHAAGTVTINPNIPAMTPVAAGSGPGAFVANFYQFALMIAGVLALGAIVYGGVKYAASAGNPSAQSDGKEWILSAIYGILLLAGAYLILYTVNPALTQLNLPVLQPVNITAPAVDPNQPVPTPGTPQAPGLNCKSGPCIPLVGVACKNGCSVDAAMAPIIQCIQSKFPQGIRITEAMPTSSPHQSACHNNGCCVDMTVANISACSQVTSLISAAQACGASALNEYFQPVGGQSCGGANTKFSTANHLHVTGC